MTAPIKQTKHLIDTYTRIAISSVPALADIIKNQCNINPSDDQHTSTIQSTDIDTVLNGPYGTFFKTKLTAYANVIRLKTILTINNDDNFKAARQDNLIAKNIPEKFLSKLEASTVKEINKKLDALTQTHYQQLNEAFYNWCQTLLGELNHVGIELSVLEIAEFSEKPQLNDLLNRFTEMKIELPKINKSDIDFTNYLKLKAQYTIVSALSRQHQAHAANDIKPYMKKIKSTFEAIQKSEKELMDLFSKETQLIVKEINFHKNAR